MSISLWWRETCPKCGKKKHKKYIEEEDKVVCNNPDCDWVFEDFLKEMGINIE